MAMELCSRRSYRQIFQDQRKASSSFGPELSLLTDGLFCSLSLRQASDLEVMDIMFSACGNAGLLILLIFGLVSANAKFKAGRKEII